MDRDTLGISIDTLSRRMTDAAERIMRYGAVEGEPLTDWQARFRAKLLELLAIDGEPKPAPPVRFADEIACDGYTRRRGYMTADDDLAVPLYVLEPDTAPAGKRPICIAAHGHGPGKIVPACVTDDPARAEAIRAGERNYAVQAVRRGYRTIVPDLRGFGELMLQQDLREGHPEGCTDLACRGAQLGRPLLGQRVSDMMQLLDWALADDDADADRVVMTGNSGGGTMTLFSAAVDRRITAAAPSCYFSTFAGSIMSMHHCPCNFVPGLLEVAEMSDLGGLVAPRPMLIIAGVQDTIFPIDAVRKGYADLAAIYHDAGAADYIELYEGPGGHRYYAARVWDFFAEKL